MKLILICFIAITSLVSIQSNQNKYIQTDPLQESIVRGSEIYTDFCINCHMASGEGVDGTFPPLAKSDYLMLKRSGSIKAVKFGQEGELMVNGKTYNSVMAPLGLSNDEVADVMNYITNSWGNKNDKMITIEEVAKLKK
ncbi:MAG: cytochrome c [Algibacter sp.]